MFPACQVVAELKPEEREKMTEAFESARIECGKEEVAVATLRLCNTFSVSQEVSHSPSSAQTLSVARKSCLGFLYGGYCANFVSSDLFSRKPQSNSAALK